MKVCKKLASRIAVLRKIRAFLPHCQRWQYYNAIILPVMSYLVLFGRHLIKSCYIESWKLQKRAATVILYADRQASSVVLFNKLLWIPFYQQCNIDKCYILYKRINRILPSYLIEHLAIDNKIHSGNNRYVNLNAICPKHKRETEVVALFQY